ncbi:MAG: ceramidase domain-containing protein [Burkholderiales bacterium]
MKSAASSPKVSWREVTLIALLVIPLALLMAVAGPIAQDPNYHILADGRALLGVPNFANVASNLAFLLVGALGLRLATTSRSDGAWRSWTLFINGITLVAPGSAYYHWTPDHQTLAWDRLPMAIAFMALFSALVTEHLRPQWERVLLPASIAIGIASVGWWQYANDLRLYAWVQFGPLLAIVFLLVVYRSRYPHRAYVAYGLVFYALAKIAEVADGAVFEWTSGALSGHTLKHLLAALSALAIYVMLARRQPPINGSWPSPG